MKALVAQLVMLSAFSSVVLAGPSIHWSGVQDVSSLAHIWPTTWHLLDVDGNGVNDFNLYAEGSGFFIEHIGAYGPNMWVVNINELGWFGGVIPLASDTLIGPDTLPADRGWRDEDVRYTFQRTDSLGTGGPWHEVSHGILGLMFDIDGNTHYGWADISSDSDYQMTLHSWAYETQPGVGIYAGAVPEPSTWALFLTGGACLLGRFLRRRAGC